MASHSSGEKRRQRLHAELAVAVGRIRGRPKRLFSALLIG
jgi:hypothetical protein